jgi:hypothetical protein
MEEIKKPNYLLPGDLKEDEEDSLEVCEAEIIENHREQALQPQPANTYLHSKNVSFKAGRIVGAMISAIGTAIEISRIFWPKQRPLPLNKTGRGKGRRNRNQRFCNFNNKKYK